MISRLMRFSIATLLLAIALGGCQGDQANLQNTVDSLRAANQTLERRVQSLQDSLAKPGEKTLSPPVYFPSGSAWIPDEGRRRLDEHAETINEKYQDAHLRIKGYTDSVPIGPRLQDTYPSNWYLSAQRAAAVAHYLNEQHDIRTEGLEIEAFGPPSPDPTNDTSEGRREKRRVEIVVEAGS